MHFGMFESIVMRIFHFIGVLTQNDLDAVLVKKQYFIILGFTAPSVDHPPLTWNADFKYYTSMENDHLAKGIFLSEKQDENFGLH